MKLRAMALVLGGIAMLAAAPASAKVDVTASGETYGLQVMNWRDIPFRTIVRQQYDYSCGSAALATLLRYHYGRHVTEADVFKEMYAHGDQAKIQKVGFSLLDMKHYLDNVGLQADGYKLTLAELAASDRPSIAVMKIGPYRHFVVIKGINGGKVLVGDPALGLKTYALKDFAAQWDGIVFAIHDEGAVKGAFNQVAEWRPWSTAPLGPAISDDTLSRLTWQMAPIYQLSLRIDTIATVPLPGSP
jgi:predicted double-glycine peptidase